MNVVDEHWQMLTGKSRKPLVTVSEDQPFLLHADVLPHWQRLAAKAAKAGFALQMVSGWRGFERQQLIWNGKASGQRAVLDAEGNTCDVGRMSSDELLFAILRWSAIPGCSRHHWGTDMDVYDAAAVPVGYQVQLTTDECVGCGPFTRLHDWLDETLQAADAVFFRPYKQDGGGIAPERWHLSCRPVADRYQSLLDEGRLLDWIMVQDIALKDRIHAHWHDIFHRYVCVDSMSR